MFLSLRDSLMTQSRHMRQVCLFCHPLFINSCHLVIIDSCADTHYSRRQAIIDTSRFIIISTVNKGEQQNNNVH